MGTSLGLGKRVRLCLCVRGGGGLLSKLLLPNLFLLHLVHEMQLLLLLVHLLALELVLLPLKLLLLLAHLFGVLSCGVFGLLLLPRELIVKARARGDGFVRGRRVTLLLLARLLLAVELLPLLFLSLLLLLELLLLLLLLLLHLLLPFALGLGVALCLLPPRKCGRN